MLWQFVCCKQTATDFGQESAALVKDSSIHYAKRFSIAVSGKNKILFLFGNKEGKDTTSVFILYSGDTVPKLNFKNSYSIKVPVKNIASMSSVYCAMLYRLGLGSKIVAIESADYYNNTEIVNKAKTGEIKELAKGPEINAEQTLLLHPGLLLTYGMGNPATDMNEKIIHAGIPVAISLDHLEEHPLARAEWIKFIACFFEKEKVADSLFSLTEKKYLALKQLCDSVKIKPTVLTEINYSDAWYVPGGKSFMAHLLSDAGADYYFKDNNKPGSIPLSFEEVFAKAGQADYWLNLFIQINTRKELLAFDERYALFKAFQNGHLYNNNKAVNSKGYSDYWENGISKPDELLKDLIIIFHPELLPGYEMNYYKKIN